MFKVDDRDRKCRNIFKTVMKQFTIPSGDNSGVCIKLKEPQPKAMALY